MWIREISAIRCKKIRVNICCGKPPKEKYKKIGKDRQKYIYLFFLLTYNYHELPINLSLILYGKFVGNSW